MPVSVGQRSERSLVLTSDHVRTFAVLTGDYNPLHFDADFAARTKFRGLVAQGGLTTGLLHAQAGHPASGPGGATNRRGRARRGSLVLHPATCDRAVALNRTVASPGVPAPIPRRIW